MTIPKFDPKELTVVASVPGFGGAPPTPVYDFPATQREGYAALYAGRPIWQITGLEQTLFCPKVNPDNVARAFVFDGSGFNSADGGGKDMFGIEWEYVAQAGGSMVRPGKPFMEDANEWREKLVWPDVDAWDWDNAARYNADYLRDDKFNVCWFLNGWYERLISFMDFEGAIMAMIDEDQQDAVKELFDKLSDLYIRILDRYVTHFPRLDGFCIHDDWGSQKETFFSPALAGEMIVPYMRRVTDFLHSKGKACELHSCGQLLKQVPNFIAAGWDSWSGQIMNDTHKIYELYGDKIIIGVTPDMYDPSDKTEQEQRAAAREYVEKFCRPEKPSLFNTYGAPVLTPAFREELYAHSRVAYARN
jgi:hypothetical protein